MRPLMLLVAPVVVAVAWDGLRLRLRWSSATERCLPLQHEWSEVIDAKTGRNYYWNTRTRETRWDMPERSRVAVRPSGATSAAEASNASSVAEDAICVGGAGNNEPTAAAGTVTVGADMSGTHHPAQAATPQRVAMTVPKGSSRFGNPIKGPRSDPEVRQQERERTHRPALVQGLYLTSVLSVAVAFL